MINLQEDFIKKSIASKLGLKEENPKVLAILVLVEEILNMIMKEERKIHLEEDKKDKGNGYYGRQLASAIGKLNLNVPRTREGDFRPSILPPLYDRTDLGYKNILEALVESGYSESAFENFFDKMELP